VGGGGAALSLPFPPRGRGGAVCASVASNMGPYPRHTRVLPGNLSPTLSRYTCMASMEIDPELSDTLMHLSGYIFRAAINAGLRRK